MARCQRMSKFRRLARSPILAWCPSEIEDPTLERNGDGVRAVTGIQLWQKASNVSLDRGYRDAELPRDLLVGMTARCTLEHLYLTCGQRFVCRMAPELGRNLWWNKALACVHRTDCIQ